MIKNLKNQHEVRGFNNSKNKFNEKRYLRCLYNDHQVYKSAIKMLHNDV